MSVSRVFDWKHYRYLNERREQTLELLLPDLIGTCNLRTALDVGCGFGEFSQYLAEKGLAVTGIDARVENIAEARVRCRDLEFSVLNIEDSGAHNLGRFDLVLCLGLLYHLENPFMAIRNLYALTSKIMLVESMVVPLKQPMTVLVDEHRTEDQSLNYVAFVPSESCIVKMLYCAGFGWVYGLRRLPDHVDFKKTWAHDRRRTVLIASKSKLDSSLLYRVPEQRLGMDVWHWSSMYFLWVRLRTFLRFDLAGAFQARD